MAIINTNQKIDTFEQFLYDAASTLKNLNYYNKVMEFDCNPNDVGTSKASIVCVAPPVYKPQYEVIQSGTTASPSATPKPGINVELKSIQDFLLPLGVVQQCSVQASSQNLLFGEVGSDIKRRAEGDTQYSATLSRVVTSHSNIRAAVYKYLRAMLGSGVITLLRAPAPSGATHWTGGASDIYHLPFGLLVIDGNARGEFLNARFLEKCKIINEGNSVQSTNAMLIDNVAISVIREVPVLNKQNQSLLPVIGADSSFGFGDFIDRTTSFVVPDLIKGDFIEKLQKEYKVTGASASPPVT